jgi:ankyrin repeat protein
MAQLGRALYDAAREDRESDVEQLLARGASPQWATGAGGTALMPAAVRGNPRVIESLLRAGADVNARQHVRLVMKKEKPK